MNYMLFMSKIKREVIEIMMEISDKKELILSKLQH